MPYGMVEEGTRDEVSIYGGIAVNLRVISMKGEYLRPFRWPISRGGRGGTWCPHSKCKSSTRQHLR